MKTTNAFFAAALAGLSFAAVPLALAQPPVEVTTTTTTTTSGTVSEFGPERIVVRTETERTPLGYTFTKTTTYVDEAGNPVSIETVKSGLPVTVYYTRDGENRVATKVVVRRTPVPGGVVEERTTTTTNNIGIISEFGPDSIVIRADAASGPLRYHYSRSTTYTDEAGNPVSMELVKSGLPVTVFFTRDGDRLNATRVVVRKVPAGEVIVEKKTKIIEDPK